VTPVRGGYAPSAEAVEYVSVPLLNPVVGAVHVVLGRGRIRGQLHRSYLAYQYIYSTV
jgi:hypothetical protein